MKKFLAILVLAISAAAYFSHSGTRSGGVCYAADCPDGCGGGGSGDPDGTGGDGGGDDGPDGTDDGSGGGDGGSGSDPDGSGGGGSF